MKGDPTDVYHDYIIGKGKIHRVRWWNAWYWRFVRRAKPLEWDGVERYIMPKVGPETTYDLACYYALRPELYQMFEDDDDA